MIDQEKFPAAAIIPARFASTRFPGKPLAVLGGKTVIERTYRAAAASRAGVVVVATDDRRIEKEVERFGGRAVMTSPAHRTGSERVEEAARTLGPEVKVVVNVQGDEPFLRPEMIDRVAGELLSDPCLNIVTLIKEIDSEEEFADPGVVKAVVDGSGFALYFSRAAIPYRGFSSVPRPFKHIGIYGFRREFLHRFVSLPPGKLEGVEGLEQLRILESGYKIKALVTEWDTIGIDTPGDLRLAAERLGRKQ